MTLAAALSVALSGCSAGVNAGGPASAPPSVDKEGPSQGFSAPEPAPQPGMPSPVQAPEADEAKRAEAPASGAERSRSRDDVPRDPSSRPGLGTSWGETRTSRITTTPFQRADPSTPFATTSMFYNDAQGARAMAGGDALFPQRRIDVGGGIVSFGLKDGDTGRFLDGFESGGRDYAVGEAGQRYVIVIQNQADFRVEVVVSVDGLDVIDGRPAGFGKRGYLVDGRGTLEIDGFRQSEDAVAAFRFGSVRDSYVANKTNGEARNVGVIGVALFHERGTTPSLWRDEVERRRDADPFPGRFATPPSR